MSVMKASEQAMKHSTGNWKVVRNCCTSGMCVDCHIGKRLGKPARTIQGANYSKAYAEYVASNWVRYQAEAVEMLIPAVRKTNMKGSH